MTVMDKLMFWKKGNDMPDFDMGKDMNMNTGGLGGQDLGLGAPNLGLPPQGNEFGQNAPFGQQQPLEQQPMQQPPMGQVSPQTAPIGFNAAPPIQPQQQPKQEFTMVSKDIELLSYKLDTLKAAIDMVNQRLANIERLAMHESHQKRNW